MKRILATFISDNLSYKLLWKNQMKRLVSYIVIIAMVFSFPANPAFALVNLSSIKTDSSNELNVDPESDCAFITSTLSVPERAFNHKYENDSLYSSTQFDILIVNYFGNSYPVLRLWINYTADKFQYITSATFNISGTKYTFSGIGNNSLCEDLTNGKIERLLIKFGSINSTDYGEVLDYEIARTQFFLALSRIAKIVAENDFAIMLAALNASLSGEPIEEEKLKEQLYADGTLTPIPSSTLILHGLEDIEINLGEGFFRDFSYVKHAFSEIEGDNYYEKVIGTALTVK